MAFAHHGGVWRVGEFFYTEQLNVTESMQIVVDLKLEEHRRAGSGAESMAAMTNTVAFPPGLVGGTTNGA
jgi:hypothetical protein